MIWEGKMGKGWELGCNCLEGDPREWSTRIREGIVRAMSDVDDIGGRRDLEKVFVYMIHGLMIRDRLFKKIFMLTCWSGDLWWRKTGLRRRLCCIYIMRAETSRAESLASLADDVRRC